MSDSRAVSGDGGHTGAATLMAQLMPFATCSSPRRGRGARAGAVWRRIRSAAARPPRTGPGYPQVYDPNMPFEPRTSRVSGRRTPPASAAAGAAAIAATAGSATSSRSSRRKGRPRSTRTRRRTAACSVATDAAAHPEEHIGRRRAQPPALGNDLYQQCNPMGIPRALLYPDPEEFIVLPDRILQHFQWGYGLRTIWMDGRALPKPEEVDIARWWGYAVGRWEGNTLVVDVDGLRRPYLGRSLRLSAQRHDGARGALHARQLRHARADDDADGSRCTTRSLGRRKRSACT